jgi:hypothetical protein
MLVLLTYVLAPYAFKSGDQVSSATVALLVLTGGILYAVALSIAWIVSGKPESAETEIMRIAGGVIGRIGRRSPVRSADTDGELR